jgi:hypothetical protein
VEARACGVTRTWLLFNYGPRDTFPKLPFPSVARFDGTYTGTFQGRAFLADGTSQPVDGAVRVVVAGGTITVTEPGGGAGSLSAKGSSRFQGAGGALGANYTFSGRFTSTVTGASAAQGGWNARFQGGTARGTGSAVR